MRKYSLLFGLSLLVAVLAASAFALKKPAERKVNPLLNNMTRYAFPNSDGGATNSPMTTDVGFVETKGTNSASLQSSSAAPSPGVTVGNTVYEYQSNGSIKRQVGVSNTIAEGAIVHFDWMYSPDAANAATGKRTFRYNNYQAGAGDFMGGGAIDVSPVDERHGYVVGDVVPALGEYVVVGHFVQAAVAKIRGYWDQGAGLGFFADPGPVPASVQDDPDPSTGTFFAWPACAHQVFGTDTITHILAHEQADEQIKYFRKDGSRETGTWTVGLVLDTANNLGYDMYASKTTGKVVLGWLANIPLTGDPDTNTQTAAQFVQLDNDFLVKISTNAGATWGPKKNVTKNIDGVSGYRPYYDLSVMIDESDQVIGAWPARQWPSDANTAGSVPAGRCRVQFWRESFAPGIIRTVAGLEWDQTDCNLGVFKMNAGRIQVARCNGRTYVMWEQGNDLNAGIMNDCAERAGVGGIDDPAGAANSDLYVAVSEDNGLTWDPARNITNTRTPGCDSATGTGGACQSEVYPTVTPFGHNYAGDFTASGTQTPIGIPGTVGSNSGYYLEVEYFLDPHAGGAIRPEGPWFLADVKWTRLECDSSIKTPVFTGSYGAIDFPAYVKHGVFRDTSYTIENTGNQTLTIAVAKYETAGPAGHLSFSGFAASIPSGLGNTDAGNFRLNTGAVVNAPGTTVLCKGGVVFTSNAPSSPDTVTITYYVTDTVIAPNWDTIYVTSATKASNRKGLTVSNNGGFGNAGDGKVNLDFAGWNDCDTNLTVYLYDGSVVVGSGGADTNMFFNIFQTDWLLETGLRPIKGPKATKTKSCPANNLNLVYTGRFTTADSNITMEKTWYAPILAGTGTNDSAWIIQCLKVYNTSGATISQAVIGEAADFDIPSDSGSDNSAGFNPVKNLIYQQGADFDDSSANGDPDCLAEDRRFGAVRYLTGSKNATTLANPSGAYSKENSYDVYPTGTFVEDSIFLRMQSTGFSVTDSVTDLHTVMTFARNQTMTTSDTFKFYTAWLSVRDGDTTALFTMSDRAAAWFSAKNIASASDTLCPTLTCCVKEGDFAHNGFVNVVDVTQMVARLFQGGPPPVCAEEADTNDNGSFNIVDLTKLVSFLFGSPSVPIGSCP